MNTPESFDRKAILSMVNSLYGRGNRLPTVYGAMGFFIGALLGLARNPMEDGNLWWLVPLTVGFLCAGIGRMRGRMMCFDLKLRAQTALCHLDIADGVRQLQQNAKRPASSESSEDNALVNNAESA